MIVPVFDRARPSHVRTFLLVPAFLLASLPTCIRSSPPEAGETADGGAKTQTTGPASTSSCWGSANYVLGPDDAVSLFVPDLAEMNQKQFGIEKDGGITLPLVGRLKAAGLTVEQLSRDITDGLKRFVKK